VCINNAGATAARLGLPPASLTVRNSNKEWNSVAGCSMPLVLWMSNANAIEVYWTKHFKAKAAVGEIRAMNKAVRAEITDHILGSGVQEVGRMHKPSTGIFAALYGLFIGAPAICPGRPFHGGGRLFLRYAARYPASPRRRPLRHADPGRTLSPGVDHGAGCFGADRNSDA
jgi:hypothetical protein